MTTRLFRLCWCVLAVLVLDAHAQQAKLKFEDYAKIYGQNTSSKSRSITDTYLVEFKTGFKRSDLKANNIEVIKLLDENIAIVKSTGLHSSWFDKIIATNDLWKIDKYLINQTLNGRNNFIVKVKSGTKPTFDDQLVTIIQESNNKYVIETTYNHIVQTLVSDKNIIYIGKEALLPQVESKVLDLNLEPNAITKVNHQYPLLTGEGLVISIKELAVRKSDIDLAGRIIESTLEAPTEDQHSTDMATIAAGAGNSFVTGKGAAKSALITSSDFINLFPDDNAIYQSLNISVQNHSYGTIIENTYGSLAESFDQSANQNQNLLHIFSSGNQGTATSAMGNYAGVTGYANLTGNFKMAKNVLVVGSVDTVGRSLAFSSKGPTYDGRIKPELVAYSMAGSSNSAAITSGVGLLIQQFYKNKFSLLPPSSLVKAVLINSAEDVAAVGPDFKTGYGNVNAYRAIQTIERENFISSSVEQDEELTIPIVIPDNVAELKLTITWNDPAASSGTAKALVNDLDMKLTDPNANEWLPWILNTNPTHIAMPATKGADHINNVEQITVQNPIAGAHTISVTGFDIPVGPQQFHIAYQWIVSDNFEWYSPTGSDNFPYNGEAATYFRWKSTFEGSGRLEYTIDGGVNWIVIDNNVNLQKGYYRWDAPAIISTAQARMMIENVSFPTDIFTISRPSITKVGFNCGDSLLLLWNKTSEAIGYNIYNLSEKYLSQVYSTSDTSFIIAKGDYPSSVFAIEPILQSGTTALRYNSIDYEIQNIDCYLTSFVADLIPNQGINLTVGIGTTYAIDRIIFEREIDGAFTAIGISFPASNTIVYFDGDPQQGFNKYRALIIFTNGQTLLSDEVETYFLTDIPFLIFPNPLTSTEELTIISKSFLSQNKTLRLIRTDGQEVLRKYLVEEYETITLNSLPTGLYIYIIETSEGPYKGKLIIK